MQWWVSPHQVVSPSPLAFLDDPKYHVCIALERTIGARKTGGSVDQDAEEGHDSESYRRAFSRLVPRGDRGKPLRASGRHKKSNRPTAAPP